MNPLTPDTPSSSPQSAPPTEKDPSPPVAKTPRQHIHDCQGLVRSLAWKIHRKAPPSVDLDDLIAYGQVGLAQAAKDFDPKHGTQFTTYAYYRIRGAIFDGMAQMSWFSRADYHRAKNERLSDDVLRLSAEQPASAQNSLGQEANWLGGVASALTMAYLASESARVQELQDEQPTPPEHASDQEVSRKLLELIDSLPTEAGQLIRAAYFEGVTLQEVSRRLGISKGWASRLHAKTLEKLGQGLRRAGAA